MLNFCKIFQFCPFFFLLKAYSLRLTAILLLLTGISFSQEIISLNIDSKDNYDDVIVETASIMEPKVFKLKEPDRIVADFMGAVWDGGKRQIDVNSKRISKIRWAQNSVRPDIVRIVIELTKKSNVQIIKNESGQKIVLKITDEDETLEKENKALPPRESISISEEALAESNDFKKKIKEIPQTAISSAVRSKISPAVKIELPPFSKFKKFSVVVNGKTLNLGKKLVFVNRTLFVPVKDLFLLCSLEVSIDSKNKTITASSKEIEIILTEGKDIISVNGYEITYSNPMQRISGRFYVSLAETVNELGLSAVWDEESRIFYVLPRITKISFEEIEGEKAIAVESTENIATFEVKKQEKGVPLVVEIPNFILDIESPKIPIREEGIRGIKAVQKNATSRIGIYFEQAQIPVFIQREKKLIIKFPPIIKRIAVTEEAELIRIDIDSTKPISPQVRKLIDPHRIMVDIPNTYYLAASKMEINKGGISRLRASQFSQDPLSSRIVIDLLGDLDYKLKGSDDSRLFSLAIERQEIAAARVKRLRILKNKIIVIDPGHGGTDPGSFGVSGEHIKEKDLTLSTSLKLARMLSDAGAFVLLTREDDTTLELKDRVQFAINNKADILLCMHYNSFFKPTTQGTETYYYNSNSKLLGELVHKNMLDNLKRPDRLLSKVKFYVIYNATMPSVLIEPLYLSNAEEERLGTDPAFQEKVAKSIFDAVKEYFEILRKVG